MNYNITRVFRFLACYLCLIIWMLTKKHISALVYMTITFIMLFGVQQLERSCSLQRSQECEGQICNLHPTRSRCIRALTSIDFYNWHNQRLEYHTTCFLSCHKYHTDLITAKESNCENKVHAVKTCTCMT